ncbi:hypothetical protein Dimus_039092 [Dionaea muscipula]
MMGYIHASQLSHLRDFMFQHSDMPLISAFVERWKSEISSFHLPFREMTITLQSSRCYVRLTLLGHGSRHLHGGRHREDRQLKDSHDAAYRARYAVHGGGVKYSLIQEQLSAVRGGGGEGLPTLAVVRDTVHEQELEQTAMYFLPLLDNMTVVGQYAWGAGALGFMYHQLRTASRSRTTQMAWIYEYFFEFQPSRRPGWTNPTSYACRWAPASRSHTDRATLLAYRRNLDQMTADVVVPVTMFTGIIHFRQITKPYMPQTASCDSLDTNRPYRTIHLCRGRCTEILTQYATDVCTIRCYGFETRG